MSDTIIMVLQALISGTAMGFIYALVGIEYTLVYNVTGLMNYAHNKFIALGAYFFAAMLIRTFNVPMYLSAFLALALMALFGYASSHVLFTPLQKLEPVYAITGTVMFGNVIFETYRIIWGVNPISILEWLRGDFHVGALVISKANVAIIIISILIVAALQFFLQKTNTGTALRCIAENKTATALMGINVSQSTALTFAISSVICCVVGLLIIPLYNVNGSMAASIAGKAFSCGVIGGFGYLPGTILGGIFLGVIEQLFTLVIPAVYKDCISFACMMIFLAFRPQGITGKGQ